MAAVNNNNQFVTKCFFIDGIGGCGKTFLLNVTLF
jgi:predicted ATPase